MKTFFKIVSLIIAAAAVIPFTACTPGEPAATTAESTSAESTSAESTAADESAAESTAAEETEAEEPFAITENGSTAVVNAKGMSYTASGYDHISDGRFVIKKEGFTAEFDSEPGKFNRITTEYSSTEPLKLYFTYSTATSDKTDMYYVEAAENGTFSCLISSYLNAGYGEKLKSVKVETCKKNEAEFVIYGVSSEEIKLINKDTYYVENDRFKVGVHLSWGGGINYVEDKTANISGLKNLVNSHDTGRLIQQSFYGTADNGEYKAGTFMDSKWVYNPVQGGDQYGNSSRLIDVRFGDGFLYIKAQPQDWSNNNFLTPSYMENTYTVTDDYIRVDNRFVDFSGWEHRFAGQELPALYTVSYLSRFTWYDGVDSWTDAELSHRDDLNFWGDAKYVNDCNFALKTGNSETWCAWTNPKDDYGLGLYVPNVDVLKAGRYNFNNSKKSDNDATNYVAPVNIIKMISYKPIEYSYIMTTGGISAIRETFKKNRDFSDNASLHIDYIPTRVYGGSADLSNISFDGDDSILMLTQPNDTAVSYSSEQKAAKITSDSGYDPHISIDYSSGDYNAGDYKTLKIEYMIPEENANSGYSTDLFICAGDTTVPDGNKRVRENLIKDGEYHTLEVDLSKLSYWKGKINEIRFDYFDSCAAGDVIYLKSFKLS